MNALLPARTIHDLHRPAWIAAAAILLTANAAGLARAEGIEPLPVIVVVGKSPAELARQPAAVTIVTAEQLRQQQPRSTEEALRGVPGVSIKPEEETAIVGNIGIRGLSSADYKTMILEDGAPIAPGLFVGNGRYYNPRIQRMDSIEILRGASSLRYGPSTIGGVINYITKSPRDGIEVGLRAGSFSTREVNLEAGGRAASRDASFGAFITHVTSDGFMDKGYDMTDVMLKAGLALGDNQRIGLKYTDYANDANISYRGLLLGEYRAGALDNPAPDDFFLTGRRSLDLNHEWTLGERARLNTVVFGSETYRDYWRYATNNAASAAAGRWVYTDNLNGNNRSFERVGIDSRLHLEHGSFGITNETELGLRYMTEEMHDTTVAATRASPRTGSLNRDVVDSADSWALYAQNRFVLSDSVAVTAGLRAEFYEQRRVDRRRTPAQGNGASTSNTELMPGAGITWRAAHGLQLFANVYQAFSPALNGDALNGLDDQQLDAERSINVEAGLRGGEGRLRYELTAFLLDFDNQIIPANSNSEFQVTNGGKTRHSGVEAGASAELGHGLSLSGNVTYIGTARFSGDRFTRAGALTTRDGSRIPYTPEWLANLSLAYQHGGLRGALSLHHTAAQFTDVANTRELTENLTGFFTGRIPGYTLADLSITQQVNERLDIGATVKNLADKRYIASLRQGIYVGPERAVDVSVRYRF